MDIISLLTTALGTAAGKALAGAAVATVSVGGLHAADVVELPLPDMSERPVQVDADATPVEPVTPAAEKEADAGEDEVPAEDELVGAADGTEADAGEPNANAQFGQDVAGLAQEEGTTGEDVAAYARENNPGATASAEARAGTPAEDGADAPEEAGERQDAEVRQDADAPHGDDQVEELRPTEPGSQADEHRPADAGADANGRP